MAWIAVRFQATHIQPKSTARRVRATVHIEQFETFDCLILYRLFWVEPHASAAHIRKSCCRNSCHIWVSLKFPYRYSDGFLWFGYKRDEVKKEKRKKKAKSLGSLPICPFCPSQHTESEMRFLARSMLIGWRFLCINYEFDRNLVVEHLAIVFFECVSCVYCMTRSAFITFILHTWWKIILWHHKS